MKDSYDAIISLGGDCAAASQMRMRGMRRCSLPFDWLYMDGPQTIEWLSKGFGDGFADFCLRENLEPLARDAAPGLAPYRYRDRASGYNFIHHFWRSIETEAGYRATYDVLRRRADRLLGIVDRSSAILFILATDFEYDTDVAANLLEALRRLHPDKEIDLHVLQHSVAFSNPCTIAEKWPDLMPFTGGRYARSISTYDINRTDAEWEFLDRLSISGLERKRFKGLESLKYKIWKRFSKHFRDNGYAAFGIRFD